MPLLPQKLGDIKTTSVNAANGSIDTGVVYDAVNAAKIGQIGGTPVGHPSAMLRVAREGLRHFLSRDIHIEFGKRFEWFQEDSNGIEIGFKDGSVLRGSVLVGADGASSAVRSQLLTGLTAQPARYLPIVGTFDLSCTEQVEELHRKASAVLIVCESNIRFMVGLLNTAPDKSTAHGYYAVCYKPESFAEESEWLLAASQQDLFDKAVGLTKHFDSEFTKYIHISGVANIRNPPLTFREFSPPDGLPNGRVTLIGDALHAMMPFRGAGANTALLDACDLAERLKRIQNFQDIGELEVTLEQFAFEACKRGQDVVAATRASGEDMHLVLGIEASAKL